MMCGNAAGEMNVYNHMLYTKVKAYGLHGKRMAQKEHNTMG